MKSVRPHDALAREDIDEETIREEIEVFVVTGGGPSRGHLLHLPSGSAVPRPLCGHSSKSRNGIQSEWRTKPVTVFPEGWADICRKCAKRFAEDRER